MREEISLQFFSLFVLTVQQMGMWCSSIFHTLLLHEAALLLRSRLILTHLACVPVDQVEDSFVLGLPGHDFMKAFPLDSVQHELQQVQLYRLLNEHNVVLRHDFKDRGTNKEKTYI